MLAAQIMGDYDRDIRVDKFGQMAYRRAELGGRRVGPVPDLIAKSHVAIQSDSESLHSGFLVDPDRLRG
jgi:hypothetical protein